VRRLNEISLSSTLRGSQGSCYNPQCFTQTLLWNSRLCSPALSSRIVVIDNTVQVILHLHTSYSIDLSSNVVESDGHGRIFFCGAEVPSEHRAPDVTWTALSLPRSDLVCFIEPSPSRALSRAKLQLLEFFHYHSPNGEFCSANLIIFSVARCSLLPALFT
jgi:hypothetical protein